jgi:hypothetical protein
MSDVESRLKNRVQLTTDGLTVYLRVVEDAFGDRVDFATLTKVYAGGQDGRYSPPRFVRASREVITGERDAGHISRSYVERQNLTMRRLTRDSRTASRRRWKRGGGRDPLHALQLCAHPSHAARDPSDGIWTRRSRVEH